MQIESEQVIKKCAEYIQKHGEDAIQQAWVHGQWALGGKIPEIMADYPEDPERWLAMREAARNYKLPSKAHQSAQDAFATSKPTTDTSAALKSLLSQYERQTDKLKEEAQELEEELGKIIDDVFLGQLCAAKHCRKLSVRELSVIAAVHRRNIKKQNGYAPSVAPLKYSLETDALIEPLDKKHVTIAFDILMKIHAMHILADYHHHSDKKKGSCRRWEWLW